MTMTATANTAELAAAQPSLVRYQAPEAARMPELKSVMPRRRETGR
jgi:hypothetical protein